MNSSFSSPSTSLTWTSSIFSPVKPSLLAYLSPSSPLPASSYPFYHTSRPTLLPGISDRYTALAVPIVAYWFLGSLFYWLDEMRFEYFEKRRLHESEEVERRNRVSLAQLIKAVVFQHVIQTALGLMWIEPDEVILPREVYVDHGMVMAQRYAPKVAQLVMLAVGRNNGEAVLKVAGRELVQFTYWWAVPAIQFAVAFFIIDTWQFFLHKLMHDIPFLYRNFHSHHHRLYVPYAFGALYNHPVEGFLLDTLGTTVAEAVSMMTVRQKVLLFGFASLKTVDDHSGYKLWWDPMQMFFSNNADYHDIHHQSFGIKKNFSQPFFTRWDILFDTVMTREQANNRHRPVGTSAEAEIEEVQKLYKLD